LSIGNRLKVNYEARVSRDKDVSMKTLVVGLGNPILGDDGVGWKIAEAVKQRLPSLPAFHSKSEESPVEVVCLSLGGIGLMEHLIGYDRAIIIDSFIADMEDVGSILVRKLNDLPNYSAFHITSTHDTSLQNAIQLGREMGAQLPEEVIVVGVAIQRIHDFGETLSTPVAEAVQPAAHIALNFLKEYVSV
jgi:hydrogenase maturation protease